MSVKRTPIGTRPAAVPRIEGWIHAGAAAESRPPKSAIYTARLTLDVTPEMRAKIKVVAFRRGLTVAELLRTLLECEYSRDDC
jgi:hypothetical protein